VLLGYLPQFPPALTQPILFGALLAVGLLVGEAVRRYAALPRITGYVLAGVVLGPRVSGLLGADALEAYRALGFLHCFGATGDGTVGYGYLIYPHKPIVSFDAASGELLNEHCVSFPDRSEPAGGQRLPDADDALAKWLALRADERGLINEANMHLPGRQLDPDHVRRDIARLSEWTSRSDSMTRSSARSI